MVTDQDVHEAKATATTDAMEIVIGDYREADDQESPDYQDIDEQQPHVSQRFTIEADAYGLDDIRNVRL